MTSYSGPTWKLRVETRKSTIQIDMCTCAHGVQTPGRRIGKSWRSRFSNIQYKHHRSMYSIRRQLLSKRLITNTLPRTPLVSKKLYSVLNQLQPTRRRLISPLFATFIVAGFALSGYGGYVLSLSPSYRIWRQMTGLSCTKHWRCGHQKSEVT